MTLSVVILTKNEEGNIKDCLESVKFADEVLVINDNSTDKTTRVARKLGAKVYKRALNNDFSAQRNFGLAKAKGKWALFLDADERVSKDLAREIVQVINDPTLSYVGLYLKRQDFLWGKRLSHGEIGAVKLLRLARRASGKWRRRVHEVWDVAGKTYTLKNPLLHYPHPSLNEFLADINRMSSLHAQANHEEGKGSSLAKIIIWPSGKFMYNFVIKVGFLDGLPGLVVSLVMSFSSFLAWGKLWLLQKTS